MSHYNYMSSSTSTVDMSSYVAVTGKPETNFSCVFGLTPQELGYLKGKFQHINKNGENEASPLVVLNALGFIGFKVIAVAGTVQEYLWTLERNLDSLPEVTCYSSARQHSSMYDISAGSGLKLEVPSIGSTKKGSGSSLSLVDSGEATRYREKKHEHVKSKKGSSRRHSLSISLNRLLHSS